MTLFVDMDDVLADTYGRHIELYNEEHKEDLKLTEIKHGEVWHNVPEIRQKSVLDHARTRGFFRDLNPIKDSIRVMEELCKKHEVYIATAATQFPNSLEEKSEWLDEHFPFISWEYRIMCGHKFILRGDLLIDDRTYNLDKFVGKTMLFSSPHNILEKGYNRFDTWEDIAKELL